MYTSFNYLEKYPLQQRCNSWCAYGIYANGMFTVWYKFDKDASTFTAHLQTIVLAKPIVCKFYVILSNYHFRCCFRLIWLYIVLWLIRTLLISIYCQTPEHAPSSASVHLLFPNVSAYPNSCFLYVQVKTASSCHCNPGCNLILMNDIVVTRRIKLISG